MDTEDIKEFVRLYRECEKQSWREDGPTFDDFIDYLEEMTEAQE